MDLGSLNRALIALKFQLPIIAKKVDLCCEYRAGENHAFGDLQQFQKLKINCGFLLNVMISSSRHVKNHSSITPIVHLCEIVYR